MTRLRVGCPEQRGVEASGRGRKLALKAVVLLLAAVAPAPAFGATQPMLFFSDLDWGPRTGWEGSATKGAAVSIWGLNFGTSRGSNYVTVNGAQLTSDSDYAEWGVTSSARGLQRITFWLRSSCNDGSGTIAVTVGGVSSATIPFRVASGAIYFIAPNGSDSNSGTTTSLAWRSIAKFNPEHNPSGDGQYIVYVRAGTYTELDVDDAFVALRGPYGGDTKRKALVGYPGEGPVLNVTNASRGVIWNANYNEYGRNDYFTFAKLHMIGGTEAYALWGDFLRVVGNTMEDMRTPAWTGVVMVDNSQQVSVFGNLFKNCGYDSYKHNIYIKTHHDYVSGDKSVDYVTVAWNEIADAYASSDNRGGAIFISRESTSGSKYVDHVYIHSNYFHGGNMEFIYTGDTTPHNGDVWVYNNVMRENTNGSGGMFFAWGTRNAYVYNNTLYGMRGEGMVAIAGSAQVYSRNNIWRSTGTQNIAIETDQGGRFNSQNDLFYGAAVPSGAGITVSSSMTADPLFVSTADLHLTSGSPARDAGTSSVSEIVTRSYDGITRPQDSGYDLGAYESGTGTGSGTELVSYVMPQVAFGGGWSTSLFLTNMGTTAADVTASFYADNGTALAVPVQGGTATTIPVSMPAGSTSRIELTSAGAVSQGWALVRMPVSVRGFGIFSLSVNGNAAQEAVIPMSEDSLQSYSMIWDDTGFDTSMSIANPGDTAVVVNFTVRLASGTQIGTGTINLSAKEKRAFVARTQFNLPSMQGAHGSMDISVASGKLAVLGLRFGPLAFTTIPAAVK